MAPSVMYSNIDHCRSCKGLDLREIYSTDSLPVAGIYYAVDSTALDFRAPTSLLLCESCGLVQLRETIDQSIYENYSFVGDSAASYQAHLHAVASMLVQKWSLSRKRILEIGASNGVFLDSLARLGSNDVMGIEPSKQLCALAGEIGVQVDQGYFGKEYVKDNDVGRFDCIIIRHVLEHIDDLNEMIETAKVVLEKDGLIVVEVPSLDMLVERKLFTNIFHEHLNYFSSGALCNLMRRHGFSPVYKEQVDIHGGSQLVIFKEEDAIEKQSDDRFAEFEEFSVLASQYYLAVHKLIDSRVSQGKVVHGYGASHRTFVLLGNAGLDGNDIPIIYDNNELLQNKYLNGFRSLVQSKGCVSSNAPDCIVVFATSFAKEITDDLRNICKYQGEIVLVNYEVLSEQGCL